MNVLSEAVRVGIVALCFAVATIVFRGPARLTPTVERAEGTCSAPVPSAPSVRWVTQAEAHELVEDSSVTFVDARSQSDFEAGHVAGALHVPMDTGTVDPRAVAMLRNARIVVTYCDTSSECARSSRLANLLALSGLSDVRVLEGGMPAWLAHGYAAEAGTCRLCP